MNNKMKKIITSIFIVLLSFTVIAKENIFNPANTVVNTRVASGCAASLTKTDLDVNNIRATIMGAGDMWWDLEDAQYEVPKGSNKNSLFAGALWIGGVDDGGNLKVAAMTYRQGGSDFWTGPLDEATATIEPEECVAWDKHFKITRAEVEEHRARQGVDPTYSMPESIENWPAYGNIENAGFRQLAPFKDVDGNGVYSPTGGDYPDYNVTGTDSTAELYGDETLWWVFNDKGNIHAESEADPLGLEIHAQAFGFEADNELNDMTFYNYKIINRSTQPLNDTYFGQWVDPDLGYYLDDYVGCDVSKGLGYCYNGDAEDEGGSGYGFNPPAIGVDFFQGPIADPNDGIDNDRDSVIDEPGEEIIMSKFVYYNNDFTVIGNPSEGIHFYNYLRGIWKDNSKMTYGGDGHGTGTGATQDECDFMFPGTTDPKFAGQEWTEVTAGNLPADRRFLQSAGPFTLQPGAVNEITTGVVWARAKSGGQTASINLVKVYDIEAQALFNSNFNILNGPDAPDLDIRELDQEIIITLSNGITSNNQNESYFEKDPYIQLATNLINSPNYEFQGYMVYQLKNSTVSQTDLADPDLARLIFRSDIKDGCREIVNHYKDQDLGVWTPVVEVSDLLSDGVQGGVDEGTQYSFRVTEDKFALSNTTLINHKTYYFMAVAYGYNPAEENVNPYDPNSEGYDGKNQPFIRGRRNIEVYHAIPHSVDYDYNGVNVNSSYGDGVEITRIQGSGNGGNDLDFTKNTFDQILSSDNHRSLHPTYESGKGPVKIQVVDPLKIPEGSYILRFENPVTEGLGSASTPQTFASSYSRWTLRDSITNQLITQSNNDITLGNETYIPSLGISIEVKQSQQPGAENNSDDNIGFISGTLEFDNSTDRWLTGVPDTDDESGFFSLWGLNWIRAGSYANTETPQLDDYNSDKDPTGVFESVVEANLTVNYTNVPFVGEFSIPASGGTWAPYTFVSYFQDGPGLMNAVTQQHNIEILNSVDIVFTSDKSKWTRSCVVESQDNPELSIMNAKKMGLRQSPSVDKDGNPDNTGTMGMGWFPGYAIDIETGERLNIIFAEDSWLASENGNDMLWNPTSNLVTEDFPRFTPPWNPNFTAFSGGSYLLGGKHFIYVVNGKSWVKGTDDYINGNYQSLDNSPSYDSCAWVYDLLANSTNLVQGQQKVFKNVSWVGFPLLKQGKTLPTESNPNDARVKLRVSKPFQQYANINPQYILTVDQALEEGVTYFVPYFNTTTYGTPSSAPNLSNTWGGVPVVHDGNTYEPGTLFKATTTSFSSAQFGINAPKTRVIRYENLNDIDTINPFSPTYSFNTMSIAPNKNLITAAEDKVKDINVVPNPYYGYSSYETNQIENTIKITNLPQRADISIFTVSGTLVRTIKKDDSMASIDWDLKNESGVPIASGLYIIHVRTKLWDKNKKEVVEKDKIIKWFGALRPIDLDTF